MTGFFKFKKNSKSEEKETNEKQKNPSSSLQFPPFSSQDQDEPSQVETRLRLNAKVIQSHRNFRNSRSENTANANQRHFTVIQSNWVSCASSPDSVEEDEAVADDSLASSFPHSAIISSYKDGRLNQNHHCQFHPETTLRSTCLVSQSIRSNAVFSMQCVLKL